MKDDIPVTIIDEVCTEVANDDQRNDAQTDNTKVLLLLRGPVFLLLTLLKYFPFS